MNKDDDNILIVADRPTSAKTKVLHGHTVVKTDRRIKMSIEKLPKPEPWYRQGLKKW